MSFGDRYHSYYTTMSRRALLFCDVQFVPIFAGHRGRLRYFVAGSSNCQISLGNCLHRAARPQHLTSNVRGAMIRRDEYRFTRMLMLLRFVLLYQAEFIDALLYDVDGRC
jgi:hypothetical protein